jgi:hypothetical protein
MKIIAFLWSLFGLGACTAWGQRPPSHTAATSAVRSQAQPDWENASITFLTVANGSPVDSLRSDEGLLNLGTFSCFTRADVNREEIQRHTDSFVVSTRFGLRIGLSSGHLAGTATVSAYLRSTNPLRTLWVDGVRLSMTPGIIARQVSYGVISEHVLKIEVPMSMPDGQMLDSIGVIYTPN